MLHSGIIGAYAGRADGYGYGRNSDSICARPAALPSNFSLAPMSNLARSPSSAFSTPSINRSVINAAYGSPPSDREMMTKGPVQAIRTSPTSVASAMNFDGGFLPYEFDGANPSPVECRAGIGARMNDRFYAVSAAGQHRLREASLDPPREDFQTPPRGVVAQSAAAMCIPCKPKSAAPKAIRATARNADSVKLNGSPSPTPGGRCRPGNHGPNLSAGDKGERPPPTGGGGRGSGSGIHPTPQNLRDNPERQAKVKTEMCHYYEEGGAKNCPFGANCNYAHGKHELKFRYTTLCLMEGSGQIVNAKTYLARPCMTWVSTGACPFGRRCAAIHDPSISGTLENPSWLPAASAKTNAQIIVDRLAAHRESVVHQENPLIPQSIWENCRPSHRGRNKERDVASRSGDNANKSIFDMEQEWIDSYALVCNSGVSIFSGGRAPACKKISDLQKLCIVSAMRGGDSPFQQGSDCSQLHRDYVFSPTHSLHSELCMILQARYFLLLDVNFTSSADVCPENVVKEISFEDYKSIATPWSRTGHGFGPRKCVTAHEVAFAPKGDHSANVSIWFDTVPVKLEQSQIKRSRRLKQKKKAQMRNGHTCPNANGALISRTSSSDFPAGPPDIDPFVPMLPAEDRDDIHCLLMAIMQHRIDSIILNNCSSVDEEQKKKLYLRMKKLQKTFMGMAKFHEKWTWPKREGMGHVTVTTRAPPGNIMPYIPLKSNKKNPCLHTWHAFAKTIGALNAHADPSSTTDDTKRLSIFLSLDGTIPRANRGGKASLPHILSSVGGWWNAVAGNSPEKDDSTWKEILLGQNGKWEAALRLHNKKMEGSIDNTTSKGRNMPLSTIPFVQA